MYAVSKVQEYRVTHQILVYAHDVNTLYWKET